MSEEQNQGPELAGHTYDGITELDNPLPSWWLWTFLFTMMFSFLYYIHYELGGGPSLKQELAVAMRELKENQSHEPALMETEETLAAAMNDQVLTAGQAAFTAKCAACHGAHLQGQVGPNLTDNYWLHGKGSRMDIIKVVREGVPDKGMPNWEALMSKDEIYAVTALIYSKKDSNPANPKAPQGELAE